MIIISNVLYQAKVGDGFTKKGILRKDSLFVTAREAVSEAFALKEMLDKKYENKIEWNYDGMMSGSSDKVKILRGLLNGNRKTTPFFLQIATIDNQTNKVKPVKPKKPQNVTEEDKKVTSQVVSFFKVKKK